MNVSAIKHSISCFLLVLFLSMKLVGLHTFCHSDDNHDEPCKICEFAITYNLTPILSLESHEFSIETFENVNNNLVTINYNLLVSNTITTSNLFSRPPPSLI